MNFIRQWPRVVARRLFAVLLIAFCSAQVLADDKALLGMAAHLGAATQARCAEALMQTGSKSYELSYERSGTMPKSPFAGEFEPKFLPSTPMPGTHQLYNMDVLNVDVNSANQGTQMDAFGHFAYTAEPLKGEEASGFEDATYFGGLRQAQIKPHPDSPLLGLGAETIPPLVTSGVLLDVRRHVNEGRSFKAGEFITEGMLARTIEAQGLEERGLLSGDIVLIYTGWSDHYQDPDKSGVYYSSAPGLSHGAAVYLGNHGIIAAGLDTPFVDSVPSATSSTEFAPPQGTPPNMTFPVHHHFLTQVGIYTLENLRLAELAEDRVSLSCTMVLPLLSKGSAGSPIRPVAYGAPID